MQIAGLPTLRQYYYWYKTSGRKYADDIARVGETRHLKDRREATGSATSHLFGIGSRFEIDATVLDVGCVAERDRRRYVGRPTLYIIIDVFSKMIVGMYLGFQPASWQTACIAIRNIVEDKVAFCGRFGLSITDTDWPVRDMLPARLLADRGEMEGYKASDFVASTGVTIENTAPYRGDMKGTVEKRFDLINRYIRQLVPGAVTTDHAERGEDDYRKAAKLNIAELTRWVIKIILYLNNDHPLVSTRQSVAMIEDQVPPIPREMWRWAQRRGLVEMRRMAYDELAFSLLATEKAHTSTNGLSFKGFRYSSLELSEQRAFVKGHSQIVKVSWDPQNVGVIWRHRPEGGYEECHITSDDYRDLSFVEATQLKQRRKVSSAEAEIKASKKFHDLRQEIEVELERILAESATKLDNGSIAGAAYMRAQEQLLERIREAVLNTGAVRHHARNSSAQADESFEHDPFVSF